MGIKRTKARFAYDIGETFVQLAPLPVISQRNPGQSDYCELGTTWINVATMGVYINASNADGIATWLSSPAGGSGVFNTLEATTGNITADLGNVVITAGNLDVVAGNATIAGTLLVGGLATFNGGMDLTSAGEIILESTRNAAPSIALIAAGGTSEQIFLHSTLGTSANSVALTSDHGGIALTSGLATENSIELNATAGGIELTATEAVDLESTQNAVNAIGISATGINGGVTMTSGTGGFTYASTGDFSVETGANVPQSIYLLSEGGTSETIEIESALGTGAGSVFIHSIAGGIKVTSAKDTVITSTNTDATAISLIATTGAAGITATSGTGGSALTSSGIMKIQSTDNIAGAVAISENGGTTSTINITSMMGTAVNSIKINSVAGGVLISGASNSATALTLTASAGGIVTNSALATTITSSQASNTAISLTASAGNGGIAINSGTGGTDINSTGIILLSSDDNIANAIELLTAGGTAETIAISSTEGTNIYGNASGASVNINSTVGGISLISGVASPSAIVLDTSNAAGGIALLSGTGGISLSAAGIVRAAPATATSASPTASATINAYIGAATFTGFTTVNTGTQAFTITNSLVTATSTILCTVANTGTNAALMTLTGLVPAAGSFVVNTTNNGSAALNGNVIISFWVLHA